MSEPELPMYGSCRCGQVRVEVSAPPLIAMACHCRGCQKMSSSAFSLSVAIPVAGFRVVAGEPVIGGLHGATKHYFCPHCLTWMYSRPDRLDFLVNLRTTMLDRPELFAPFVETCMDEKLPWAKTSAEHSYPSFPPMEDFGTLMKDYAALPGDGA